MYFPIYGIGSAAVITILWATAIQLPATTPVPIAPANIPPAIGPAALNPIVPKIRGDPNITPVIRTGVIIIADTNPMTILFSKIIF
jgi:hypothetical protein